MNRYRRGTDKERACIELLTKAGYICMRTAGSHGPFDVIAIGPQGLRLIQVKRTKNGLSKSEVEAIREELSLLPRMASVSYELWIWEDNRGWKQEVI